MRWLQYNGANLTMHKLRSWRAVGEPVHLPHLLAIRLKILSRVATMQRHWNGVAGDPYIGAPILPSAKGRSITGAIPWCPDRCSADFASHPGADHDVIAIRVAQRELQRARAGVQAGRRQVGRQALSTHPG